MYVGPLGSIWGEPFGIIVCTSTPGGLGFSGLGFSGEERQPSMSHFLKASGGSASSNHEA